MLNICSTCSTPLVAGARFCVECGAVLSQEEPPKVALDRASLVLNDLVNLGHVRELVTPDSYGKPKLEELAAAGDYAQATTDFETFFSDRPPLLVTVVIASGAEKKVAYDQLASGCGQNILGYVEFADGVLFVSADYARDPDLPDGLELFGTALGGDITRLIGTPINMATNKSTMYSAAEDILDIFRYANLVSSENQVPEHVSLRDGLEVSLFNYVPDLGNQDTFLIVSIYLGVPASGIFGFSAKSNRATLADENWVIEFSSASFDATEFTRLVETFQNEVGGELKLC